MSVHIYGLIGKSLGHSFSKKFFTGFFSREGLAQHEYRNFEMENLEEGVGSLKSDPEIKGLNVTIPYKAQIIPYLDWQSEEVAATGACNCIAVKDREWHGYNTDIIGFRNSFLARLGSGHKRALILGDGGAAAAVKYVLTQLQIPFQIVSRKSLSASGYLHYTDITEEVLASHQVVINTTPLGMYPDIESMPPLPYQAVSSHHYFYDLVYNPEKTRFLQEASIRGATTQNGADMLTLQAEAAWRIWAGL